MEQRIGIERMEEAVNLFGSFDENIRLLETEFQVQAVNRGGEIVVSGEPENVMLAVKAVQALLTLSNKGETITDQHVRYVIGLVRSGQAARAGASGGNIPIKVCSVSASSTDLSVRQRNMRGKRTAMPLL